MPDTVDSVTWQIPAVPAAAAAAVNDAASRTQTAGLKRCIRGFELVPATTRGDTTSKRCLYCSCCCLLVSFAAEESSRNGCHWYPTCLLPWCLRSHMSVYRATNLIARRLEKVRPSR